MFKKPKNSSSCLDEGVYRSGNICVSRLVIVVGAVLLISPLLASLGQASDVPLRITYTGTVLDTSHNVAPDLESPFPLPLYADVVNGQSEGTFGASMTTILTEFRPPTIEDPAPPLQLRREFVSDRGLLKGRHHVHQSRSTRWY